jgi:hypothetical protein
MAAEASPLEHGEELKSSHLRGSYSPPSNVPVARTRMKNNYLFRTPNSHDLNVSL